MTTKQEALWYILSSDKRAVVMDLLSHKPMDNASLHNSFEEQYSSTGFFSEPSHIGQIIKNIENKDGYVDIEMLDKNVPIRGIEEVMHSSLTPTGEEMQIYARFALETAYRREKCLMEMFGYEQGGPPTVPAAMNRVETFKRASLGEISVSDLRLHLKQIGIITSTTKIRRHCDYLDKQGLLDIKENGTNTNVRLYEFQGIQDMEGLSAKAKDGRKYFPRLAAINETYEPNDVIDYKYFSDLYPGWKPRQDFIEFLLEHNVINKKPTGTVIAPNEATRFLYNELIVPLEGAMTGDRDYALEILSKANVYSRNRKTHGMEVTKKCNRFYKHMKF
ncbi:hypothetical protein K9M79_06120 [Candidatus Woesearchaeota archaeon]|nr:hypothetical protein [Candidatus Woesearchaeota archaeon]